MFRYALFDLDGTLTDPKVGITTCVQYALHSFGIEEETDKLTPFIGPPLKKSFMEFYGLSEEQAEQAIRKYRERFSTVGLFENEIYPGTAEMLYTLHKKGMKLAVASSKPTVYVKKILEHFKIEQYFDVVVGSELDGRRTDKQEVVQEALRQLGVTNANTDECVMVGDRKFDIIGAKAEHIHSVGVTFGYAEKGELEAENPDSIAANVQALTTFLLYENNGIEFGKKASINHAFGVIWPVLIFYFVVNSIIFLSIFLMQFFSLNGSEAAKIATYLMENKEPTSAVIEFIAMGTGAGVLIPMFRRENPFLNHKKTSIISVILVVMMGICSALFFNVFFSLTGISGSSEVYKEVAKSQFSFNLIYGLVLYGVVSPLAEEIAFRGIVYNRLRKYFSFSVSVIISSVLFGVYHGNIVQALYGFILGMIIGWAYERFESFLVPVLVHSAANIAVYVVVFFPYLQKGFFNLKTCIILGVLTMFSFVVINILQSGLKNKMIF